jgi:hypothetical protein
MTDGKVTAPNGAIAQVVERFHGMEEVEGSSPSSSTGNAIQAWSDAFRLTGFFLGGLVAGEGSFAVTRKLPPFANGDPRLRFLLTLTMADRDRPLLVALRSFLGAGSITDVPSPNGRWLPRSQFVVSSMRAHRSRVMPFAEEFVPRYSAKWAQFRQWHQAIEAYELDHPNRWGRGRSQCSVADCLLPVRGRGLCRRHYYRETGY